MHKKLIFVALLFNLNAKANDMLDSQAGSSKMNFYFANQANAQCFDSYVIDLNLPLWEPVIRFDHDGDRIVSYTITRDLTERENLLIQNILNGFLHNLS